MSRSLENYYMENLSRTNNIWYDDCFYKTDNDLMVLEDIFIYQKNQIM